MTKLAGILNLTPDSFSDGGQYADVQAALDTIRKMQDDGADAVDIGAESTRPGATPLDWREEWARLAPVLSLLHSVHTQKCIVSLDTRHAECAARALDVGVDCINDVSGVTDAAMVNVLRKSNCTVIVMHALSVPADRQIVLPEGANPVQEVLAFAGERIAALEDAGIARERLLFDPGIGFGKTAEQSLALLRGIAQFSVLGVPLYVGHSRKSFLSAGDHEILRFAQDERMHIMPDMGRDQATLAVSYYLAKQHVDWLRVHNVAAHRRILDMCTRLDGI